MLKNKDKTYDVIVIGGGVSGTALFYALSKYSTAKSIAIIEKYSSFGQVNSKWNNNSQTLHTGDIETNYSLEKASIVKPAALMVSRYVSSLEGKTNQIIFPVSKMVLAVGKKEVVQLEKRYLEFKTLYPDLKRLEYNEITKIEPAITKGRSKEEMILALYTPNGYAVDFEALAKSFVNEATRNKPSGRDIDVFLDTEVIDISKSKNNYKINTRNGTFESKVVVVNTDAYSLYFAKLLGYGKEFSLIPVAGNFYFSKQMLNGKVYTMQDKKLPFAAVHGDPDIHVPNKTRWGPTAKMSPVLESRNFSTTFDYFKSASLFRLATIKSFLVILSDMARFVFLLKNTLYDIPVVGKYFFVKNVQKIVPTIQASDLRKAKGFGGMRLQRVNTKTHELQLGEGKIIGDNIIFNMTPSPGASVCLFNGMRDAEKIMEFFVGMYQFDKCKMEDDFGGGCFDHDKKVISENAYVS